MKKVLFLGVCLIVLSSCNKMARIGDSEIDAIRDQTEAIKEQTEVLKKIEQKMK
jgi:hypothetical protein